MRAKWLGSALGVLSLLLAWVPWAGVALALLGFLLGERGRRPRALLAFSLLLGLIFTAAFLILPRGGLEAQDPRLELLEDRFQTGGNLEEIDPLP